MKCAAYFIGVALQPHLRWDSTGELAGAFFVPQNLPIVSYMKTEKLMYSQVSPNFLPMNL
ncbi:MAG: hypothetical protein BBJ57_01460 [Desulfobacterales bacterium PC51MH44]|nr:MAG: hypothetical protein BBJ57_01460 [Desulfobacterales bacterium PC51MH44]